MSNRIESETQETQYSFPYHYIPDPCNGHPRLRYFPWAFEYLCYQNEVARIVTGLNAHSVLEVGCGDGRWINTFCTTELKVGCDISATAIGYAKAFSRRDTTFYVGTAQTVIDTFDAVVAIEVLEHIPDDHELAFLQGLLSKAKSGGTIVICVPSILRKVHRKHYRHYSISTLQALINKTEQEIDTVTFGEVFEESFILRAYQKLTMNKYWIVSIPFLEKLANGFARRTISARTGHGTHIIVVIKKR